MDEINIPEHLVVPCIVCIVALILIYLHRKKLFVRNKAFWISSIIFLTVYTAIVSDAIFWDIAYQIDLNRFDTNKDGFFDQKETTAEQQKAMSRLINDTGRNFTFITGFIYAFFISLTFYAVGLIFKLLPRKKRTIE